MSIDIAIIDLGIGNIFSVEQACKQVGLNSKLTDNPTDLTQAKGIILPGVGAFGAAMKSLDEKKMISPLLSEVEKGKPLFGICLGMQLLFEESTEHGSYNGLGIIPGKVQKFPLSSSDGDKLTVPLISWREVRINNQNKQENNPMSHIKDGDFMYFVHSYFCKANNEIENSNSTYGDITYTASVLNKNVFATQFHPEKCGDKGIQIYENWAKSLG